MTKEIEEFTRHLNALLRIAQKRRHELGNDPKGNEWDITVDALSLVARVRPSE